MSDNKKMMEIAEKIIKEYSKDFNTDIIDIYRVDFDNMKALCDKEFEKNKIIPSGTSDAKSWITL